MFLVLLEELRTYGSQVNRPVERLYYTGDQRWSLHREQLLPSATVTAILQIFNLASDSYLSALQISRLWKSPLKYSYPPFSLTIFTPHFLSPALPALTHLFLYLPLPGSTLHLLPTPFLPVPFDHGSSKRTPATSSDTGVQT